MIQNRGGVGSLPDSGNQKLRRSIMAAEDLLRCGLPQRQPSSANAQLPRASVFFSNEPATLSARFQLSSACFRNSGAFEVMESLLREAAAFKKETLPGRFCKVECPG